MPSTFPTNEPFALRHGRMCAEAIPLASLHRAVGPCYVYSRAAVERRTRAVLDAFGPRAHLVAYAVKANTNPGVLRCLRALGLGAEAVSEAELDFARRAGFPGSATVFNGNGKRERDLRAALAHGAAYINVDGSWELPRLQRAAHEAGRTLDLLLRVNPALDPDTHPHIATGLATSKFGMDFGEAEMVARRASDFPALRMAGLHVHLGSQIRDAGPLHEGFARVRDLGLALEGPGFRLEVLNLGGGFGVDYAGTGRDLDLSALARGLDDPGFWGGRRLILEPGRYLVADAGVLVGSVLGVKLSHGRRFVIVDLGMNDLLRPALYDAFHEVVPVAPREGETVLADVVGPICESGDFLARDRELPPLLAGDLVAVRHVGAYGYSMASNYNGRLRLPEVWVDGDRAWLTRRGETLEDLARLETRDEIPL
ncbi:MAG: diaminopimelate decarboxylase [Candidatus Eisenbacteria bacterium]|nr:diaminopimelate decarboxylase [Candidatus Eisenbacteria bacterium]